MQSLIKLKIFLGLFFLVNGCASNNVVHMDTSGPTMTELMRHGQQVDTTKIDSENTLDKQEPANVQLAGEQVFEGYSRDSINEIDQLFPLHPNPKITVYIHPHLATSGNYPVPGYTTAFSLYEKDEYALPGELPPKFLTGASKSLSQSPNNDNRE